MKKRTTKGITIDGLAMMVAKGFESVHNDIGEVKSRLSNVEDRLGNVEDRLSNVEDRLGNVEDRLGNVEGRLVNVEESLKVTRRDILNIGDRFVPRFEFDNLLIRVGKIEQRGQSRGR